MTRRRPHGTGCLQHASSGLLPESRHCAAEHQHALQQGAVVVNKALGRVDFSGCAVVKQLHLTVVLSVVGALVVLLVLYLITLVRPWHYPVRDTTIDLGERVRSTDLLDRGPSAETEQEFEAEEP